MPAWISLPAQALRRRRRLRCCSSNAARAAGSLHPARRTCPPTPASGISPRPACTLTRSARSGSARCAPTPLSSPPPPWSSSPSAPPAALTTPQLWPRWGGGKVGRRAGSRRKYWVAGLLPACVALLPQRAPYISPQPALPARAPTPSPTVLPPRSSSGSAPPSPWRWRCGWAPAGSPTPTPRSTSTPPPSCPPQPASSARWW